MLCQTCKDRDTCTELCEPAERYVGQDHVSQRETPHEETFLEWLQSNVSLYTYEELSGYFSEESVNFPCCTELQNRCLSLFYFEGLSYAEIAMKVNYRVHKVNYQIYSAKQRISKFFSIYRGESEDGTQHTGD